MSKMRFIAMGVAGAAALGAAFLANGFLNKPVKTDHLIELINRYTN